MKRFQVIWSQVALDAITEAWSAAPSELRNAILKAWHRIDDVLVNHPDEVGESREESRRIWFEFPLGVLFKVDAEKKEVRVLQVWIFKKRN